MRQTITIPASGVSKVFNQFSGRSVIVEEMPLYSSADQVPIMDFQPGIVQYPLYARSDYPNDRAFSAIRITGTDESAGDEITLMTTEQCLELAININFSSSYEATVGTTSEEVLSDSVFSFSAIAIKNAEGSLPKRVYINSIDDSLRYAFNVDPEQGVGGLGYLLNPEKNKNEVLPPVEIEGINFILAVRFINETNGTPATLLYTFEY